MAAMADKEKLKKFQDFARECLDILGQSYTAQMIGDKKKSVEKADEVFDKILDFEGTVSYREIDHVVKIYEVLRMAEKRFTMEEDFEDDEEWPLMEQIELILADDYHEYDLG